MISVVQIQPSQPDADGHGGLFAYIFFDVLAYTGKEHRLLQVGEAFCVIPIYNCPLH